MVSFIICPSALSTREFSLWSGTATNRSSRAPQVLTQAVHIVLKPRQLRLRIQPITASNLRGQTINPFLNFILSFLFRFWMLVSSLHLWSFEEQLINRYNYDYHWYHHWSDCIESEKLIEESFRLNRCLLSHHILLNFRIQCKFHDRGLWF